MVRELVPLLMVQEIHRSVHFYNEKLGFTLAAKWEPAGVLRWCRLERDRSAVMLQQASAEDGPAEGRGRGVTFYFICDDVDAMHAELSGRGMRLNAPTVAFYGMKQIHLRDPDGYDLWFESPSETP